MSVRMRRVPRIAAALAAALCLLAGVSACAGETEPTGPSDPSTQSSDHVDAGNARELSEPLTRLALIDPSTGETVVLDAADETETTLGSFGPTAAATGDGRFIYLNTDDGLTIVDAGAWTYDHGDHYHYFATEPTLAGTVEGSFTDAVGQRSLTALRPADGTLKVFDRDELGEQNITAADGFATAAVGADGVAAAVPYQGRIVAATESGTVRVLDEHGGAAELAGKCVNAQWGLPTRRALVFGCQDGALRITGSADELRATTIPFPSDAPISRPDRVDHRDRADVFAGLADDGVWVLDTSKSVWTAIPLDNAVAANTAGEGSVLVLTRDGILRAIDVATRTETAHAQLFPQGVPADVASPRIEIDTDRAYVNDHAGHQVYEIDYRDGLRVSRTLPTSVPPGLMVEAGR